MLSHNESPQNLASFGCHFEHVEYVECLGTYGPLFGEFYKGILKWQCQTIFLDSEDK